MLVHEAVIGGKVALGIKLLFGEEAKQAETIVERDHNDVAALDERRGIEVGARALGETAAVNPYHDGAVVGLGRVFSERRVDVQKEAIFLAKDDTTIGWAGLRALVAAGCGLQYPCPCPVGLRQHPAQRSNGRCGIGNSEIRDCRCADRTLQAAALRNDDWIAGTCQGGGHERQSKDEAAGNPGPQTGSY